MSTMSGRGGKRRQVLQMGNASKLHRYGYSKEFHSKNKKGKGTITSLVGEFSDTDSDDNGDIDDPITGDVRDEEEDLTPGLPALGNDFTSTPALPDRLEGSVMPEKPADMDDEFKNFLSEIEAIPMPTNGSEQEIPADPDLDLNGQSDTSQDIQVPVTKARPINNHYSMFVKGKSEFVHSPKATDNNQMEPKEEDFPEEPSTNWQMVQDDSTQYYYYWNTVTNEVTWEIPTDYTQFLLLHREYEEKIAKYTPEQVEKLKEKYIKIAIKDPGVQHLSNDLLASGKDVKSVETHSLIPTAMQDPDRRPHKTISDTQHGHGISREASPSKSLSPHPETGPESKHHKHKKEKRSHHKKKHKRKTHGDQHSDEEKHSPKLSDVSQPPSSTKSLSTQSSATIVAGYKLLSIVPYLSDQDDSDEDENSDPVPQLGPVISSVMESKVEKESVHEGEPLEPRLSPPSTSVDADNLVNDTSSYLVNDTPQPLPLSQKIDVEFPTSLLLLPPPPPPPLEEEPVGEQIPEGIPEIENNITQQVDELLAEQCQDLPEIKLLTNSENILSNLSTVAHINNSTVAHINHSTVAQLDNEVNEMISAIADPITSTQLTENEPNALMDTKQDSSIVETQTVKVSQKSKHIHKEVIDMFAEHFPLSIPSQDKEDTLVDKDNRDMDIHLKEVIKAAEPLEEVMEEGEILEVPEKEAVVQKEKQTVSGKSWQNVSEKSRSEVVEEKILKSINIVGYASDDEEEEEGEVRERVVKKEEIPPKKEEKLPARKEKKKKDKKRESKKHRKVVETDVVSILDDNRLDKKVVNKAPVPLTQAIPEIVSQQVAEVAVKKPETEHQDDDDDVDLEFDLDDIDRALEVALEKKLEKKKVELQEKVGDKENKIKDEALHITASGDLKDKLLISDVAVCQTINLDNMETIADNDSPSHTMKTPLQDSPSEIMKPLQDSNNITEIDETKVVAEIKEMAELALNKLEFLDISTDNLSRLQVLFIELQTRHTDWTAGGLSTQYFYEQLKIAEGLLEQYELSAVPDGWACQWDRANNRYYYRNTVTNRIQWEYPDGQSKENEEPEVIAVDNDEPVIKVRTRGSDEHRRSRGISSGRSKKKDDKEKSKHDRRSSSRHYHRKRRRGRDQSNSSNSSVDSQQHRRHRKNKKKKKHRVERSPSVEIVECIDRVDVDEIEDTPNSLHQLASPSLPPASDSPTTRTPPDITVTQDELSVAPDGHFTQPSLEDPITAMLVNQEADGEDIVDNTTEEATDIVNPVVISKPPQILIHPSVTAELNPDGHPSSELYPNPQIIASAPVSFYPSYLATHPITDLALPSAEMTSESNETSLETDKAAKKKKKDKKSLATGSSIMMKKKHMSSMVQKWQKVKIEVEKEDRAKELRQAAIRKKIEELKSSDKPS